MDEASERRSAWGRIVGAAHEAGTAVTVATVCTVCAEELEVDAVGITLITDGELRVVACATDERASRLEDCQLIAGEGPCTEAFLQDTWVEEPALHCPPSRWPAFTQCAAGVGIGAVAALPLSIGDLRIGVLDLYRTRSSTLTGDQRNRAFAYARILAVLVLDEHPHLLTMGTHASQPGPQGYPPTVHQAAGMLAARTGLTTDDALARLRAHAYSNDLPLLETADHVISGRSLDPEEDATP